MTKNFDTWNIQKKGIQEKSIIPYFHEREIWYVSLGANVGVEQDGKGDDFSKPVVIVRKINRHSFYALPLTSVDKSLSILHVQVTGFELGKQSFASLSQLKVFDSKRLLEKRGMIPQKDFKKLGGKIKELFS